MRRVLLLGVGVSLLCVGVVAVGTTVEVADRTYTAESVPERHVDHDDEVTPVEELPSETRWIATALTEGESYEPKRYQFSIVGSHFATISTDENGVHLGLSPAAERFRSVRYLRQDGTHYRVIGRGGTVPVSPLLVDVLSAVLLIGGGICVGRGTGFLDVPEIVTGR